MWTIYLLSFIDRLKLSQKRYSEDTYPKWCYYGMQLLTCWVHTMTKVPVEMPQFCGNFAELIVDHWPRLSLNYF